MAVTRYVSMNGRIRGETTSGARTDYLTDALGSVTGTVNEKAELVNAYRYKPYGAPPLNCDDVTTTLFHELAHFCGTAQNGCNDDRNNDDGQQRNNTFAKCLKSCLRYS